LYSSNDIIDLSNKTKPSQMEGKAMKKYRVLEVNAAKNEAIVIATIEAKNEKEARVNAFAKYGMYVDIMAGRSMVVASDNRYEQYYREMVEATDRKMM
jgi:hypothetical protein